ncbi:hypothetical protein [Streptomyces fagopyri]|uniref:hypothetical protein n=1 Tax=Streptomyces fagopyri TaxID=2662397 RepID=UPI0037153E83
MPDMHGTAGQRARLMINEATAAGIRVPALSGEVDADNVRLLRQALRVDGTSASRTVPDLSGLAMDSSAIGVLAAEQRGAASAGDWTRLAVLIAFRIFWNVAPRVSQYLCS